MILSAKEYRHNHCETIKFLNFSKVFYMNFKFVYNRLEKSSSINLAKELFVKNTKAEICYLNTESKVLSFFSLYKRAYTFD